MNLSRLSFGTALTLAVVSLMALPGGVGAFLFVRQGSAAAREAVVGELRIGAQNAADQLRRELDLQVTRARTLGFDSDLQMGMRSVLFFERIEQRLGNYNAEAPLSLGAWFFGAEGVLIATAPQRLEALRPFPFDAALGPWLATLGESVRARQRHLWVTAESDALLAALDGAAPGGGPALYLFTPVRDFLGAAAGAVVTLVSPVVVRRILLSQLREDAGVSVSLDAGAPLPGSGAATPERTTLAHRIEGEAVVSRLAVNGLSVELRQDFHDRLAEARRRDLVVVLVLSVGLLLLGASAFLLARVFVRPFGPLREVVRAFGEGRYDVAKPRVAFLEFREFMDTIFAMAGEVKERIRERETLARRDADLKREQMSAELGALRSQMNPHFLFNALNGVQSLLDIDADAARGMLQQLSDLFREILECSRLGVIPVERERRIVERYLALQKRRFGRRLAWAFEAPPGAARAHVPSLMIQTLVENAVKHGVEASREGATVTVEVAPCPDARGGWLCTVRNAGHGPAREGSDGSAGSAGSSAKGTGTGTGLANTRRRLALLYGEAGTFALAFGASGDATATFWFSGERVDGGDDRAADAPGRTT